MVLRENISKKAIEYIHKYDYLALSIATGVGKSKIAIDCINSFKNKNVKVLILVAEKAHKENWKKELIKWKIKTSHIRIECYQSFKKCLEDNYDFIIYDEAHHLYTDIRLSYFNVVKTKKSMFLSATIKWELLKYINDTRNVYIPVLKCSLQKAIDNNILPEPVVRVHLYSLDDNIRNKCYYKYIGCTKKTIHLGIPIITCTYPEKSEYTYSKLKRAYGKCILKIMCTEQEKYNMLDSEIDLAKYDYMTTREPWAKIKWLSLGSERKRYLGELKTEKAEKLINEIKENKQRFICFCTSIEQAEALGNEDNIIHSERPKTAQTIERFNTQKINSLIAVGMLQEGQNLNNIQTGIIIQVDGKERAFIQKFGRTLRSEKPVQHILCFKNTKDMEYVGKALEGINKNYIEIIEE